MAIFGNKKKTGDEKDSQKEVSEKKTDKKTVKKDTKKTEETSMKDLYQEKDSKKGSGSKAKKTKQNSSIAYKVLVKPLVTEKATNLVAENKYAFVVALNTNKLEVAKAVKSVYGVDVEGVNIIKMKGKRVSRGRIRGQRSDFKKAIVTLKKGQSINLYEGV